MTGDKIKYDAFISYRHSETDSFVAETLHRQLESFKLPRNVARRRKDQENADAGASGTNSVKTRIQRVFRDKEELPLVSNLADPITEALENSEYLIVICSPRLPESMWCRKEIETFIEMHDREHVLAVLVEGEPDTSFPEELLYREETKTEPDGSVISKKVPVEPLAADVRSTSRRKMRKKIKSELLRLVAPMFDCSYDDLKQRHKEQQTRRFIMTAAAVSAVCLVFGIVSTTMALRIQHQNTQITEQNVRIRAQSDEIGKQAQEIEKQYREVQRRSAVSRAKEAENYLASGNRIKAISTARDALMDLSEGAGIKNETDYPAEAVRALTDSLYLYENGQQILPDRILEMDTAVRVMKVSPKGSRIVTVDNSGQVALWQPGSNPEQIKLDVTVQAGSAEHEIAFLGEDSLFCPVGDEVVLYDLSGGSAEEAYRIACEDYVGVIVLQEQQQAILLSENGYMAADCRDGSLIYAGEWDLTGLQALETHVSACSADDRYWAVSLGYNGRALEEMRRAVVVYDTFTGERIGYYPIAYEYIKSIRFDREQLYVVSDHSGNEDGPQATAGMEGQLQAFAIGKTEGAVWTYERHNGWLYETSCADRADSDYLLCSGYSDIVVVDKRDGSYIDSFGMGVEITKLGNYAGSDNFMAFTRDGVWHYLNMERREDMVGMQFPACTSANVMDFAIGDGFCVTLPYSSRQVSVYRTAAGPELENFYQNEESYRDAVLSADGTYLAASFYNSSYTTAIDLFDTNTGELLWNFENSTGYKGMVFFDHFGQEALALLTDQQLMIMDVEQGSCLDSIELTHRIAYKYLGCSKDNSRLLLWDDESLYIYDLTELGKRQEILLEETQDYNGVIAADSSLEYLAAVDKEEEALCFYRIGDNGAVRIYTYDKEQSAAEQSNLNYKYIKTMFFDKEDAESHLYIVYLDGRITRLDIDFDNTDHFCRADSHRENPEKYNGLDDVMGQYIHAGDYALIYGSRDAYLLSKEKGDILAQMHGFLACDGAKRTVYLTDKGAIYKIPLYTLEEIDRIAAEVLQPGAAN